MLRFAGSEHFRQRLVCSTLSGKPIRIDDIRSHDQNPGLRDYEASLLRLLEKVTNGCIIEINETGTSLRYKPGFIYGGAAVEHDCGTSRAIGYFLEPLACLAMFGKKPLSITLRGMTNDGTDCGVDVWRTVTFPLLRQLTELDDFELKIVKRGAPPGGGGEVFVRIPNLKQLPPISLTDEGMVKRVRGVAYSMRVSPQNTNRMVDGARGVLNQASCGSLISDCTRTWGTAAGSAAGEPACRRALLADVYIFTDHMTGPQAGASPGYGITLVAETTSGRLLAAEASAAAAAAHPSEQGRDDGDSIVPEDIGKRCALALLEEIERGGVVDSCHQASQPAHVGLVLLLCALGPEEINEVRLGPLTPYAVRTLRHVRDFFGVTFNVRPERESQTIFLSCIGAAIRNMSKRIQ
ncbi:hypothetical protein N2152v2_001725 [Parachlorella kessleri]